MDTQINVLISSGINKDKSVMVAVSVAALFCDYYNPPGECEWHYKPCGHTCMKTCRNPIGNCTMQTPALEGMSLCFLFVCLFLI